MIALRLLAAPWIAAGQLLLGLCAALAWTWLSSVRYVRTGRWTLKP